MAVNDHCSSGNSSSVMRSGDMAGFGKFRPMKSKGLGPIRGFDGDGLPRFREVPSSERVNLFIKKLNLCCVVYDFRDPEKNLMEKNVKRETLRELVEFLMMVSIRFDEVLMQEIAKMVAVNLFRTLPDYTDCNGLHLDLLDLEDDEPLMDPSWPHLQYVYQFLLKILSSPEMDPKIAKRYFDSSFVWRLLNLFDSVDRIERDYLKGIIHKIYARFMVHRPFIRQSINSIFYCFIFETEKHNGIGDLLEISGSVINGFALPLKEEHRLFLVRLLIPLHKPKGLSAYHHHLSYCIRQFVDKDFKLADTVIRGLLKYWPIINSSKQVMFLGELEEVLEATRMSEFQGCVVPLFRRIGQCFNSSHFQVAERALLMCNNNHIRQLILVNRAVILPIVLPYLERNISSHWSQTVQSLTLNVRNEFCEADQALYNECLVKLQVDEIKEVEAHEKRESMWKQLEDVAASKAVSNESVLVKNLPLVLGSSNAKS